MIVILSHHAESLIKFRGEWIRTLCSAGHSVTCFAPDYTDARRTAVRGFGAVPADYSLRRAGMNPARDLCDMVRLIFLLRKTRARALFSFSIKPVIYGTLAGLLARIPKRVAMIEGAGYIFTESGDGFGRVRRVLRWLVRQLYKLSLRHAHRVIFLNPDDEEEFVSLRLVRRGQCALLGGIGVDLREWAAAPAVSSPVTFLLIARLLREKGIVEYVEAARRVRQECPAARFVLLGGLDSNPGGLSRAEVQSWVDEGIVEWPGHVEVGPWIAQASVFVLPSYREGVPRSTQEAMAMARPVITTDAPGCRETVVEGVNGYLVPVRDVEALARAMMQFVHDPEKIAPMGLASRRLAEERFDVRRANAQLTEWLLGTSRQV